MWAKNSALDVPSTLFLVDYEFLGSASNGLALIEELGMADKSILVTSRYEDAAIVSHCLRTKLRLIPKSMAGFIPLAITSVQKPDAVLLDDDDLVHFAWDLSAQALGKKLDIFSEPGKLFAAIGEYSADTKFYIDSNLGADIKGEQVAERLHRLGFNNLYLATGSCPDLYSSLTFLKGVVDKLPPWNDN
jgi:hypothetical protein